MSPSREETLRELLARVHERLSHAQQVDARSRELLTQLMLDIGRTLDSAASGQSAPAAQSSKDRARDPLPRLEALAVRFETEHPALGQVLRQLVDFLSNAGI